MEETCYVCYGSIDPSDRIVLPDCGHVYCRSCIVRYLTVTTVDGQVHPTCFYPLDTPSIYNEDVGKVSPKCNVQISSNVIQGIMISNNDEILLKKYNRFLFIKENLHARECPRCDHIQIWNEKLVPIDVNTIEVERKLDYKIVCDSCDYEYCYQHGGAHEGETCDIYIQSVEKELVLSNEFIALSSKPCPGCRILLSKSSGCNHMVCTQCNTNFCWLCGKSIEPLVFPSHFQWWRAGSCSNMQMNEEIDPSWRTRLYARVLSLLEIIILGPITIAATVATYITCFCFVPSALACQGAVDSTYSEKLSLLTSSCMSLWGMFFIFILFLVPVTAIVVCIGTVVMLLVVCILLPIYIVLGFVRISRGESPFPIACRQWLMRLHETLSRTCCLCINSRNTFNKCRDIENGMENDKSIDYTNIDPEEISVVIVDDIKSVEENNVHIVTIDK